MLYNTAKHQFSLPSCVSGAQGSTVQLHYKTFHYQIWALKHSLSCIIKETYCCSVFGGREEWHWTQTWIEFAFACIHKANQLHLCASPSPLRYLFFYSAHLAESFYARSFCKIQIRIADSIFVKKESHSWDNNIKKKKKKHLPRIYIKKKVIGRR